MILARLLSAAPTTDGEHWNLQFREEQDIIHTDAYAQNPLPFQRVSQLGKRTGVPWPWKPGQVVFGDGTFGMSNTFGVSVDAGSFPANISIYGNLPVNIPASTPPPAVPLQASTSNTGGSITPGSYLIAVSANGVIGPISALFSSVLVPSGTSTNTITVSGIQWPRAAAPAVAVFAGADSLHMVSQPIGWTGSSPDANGNPTVITITFIDTQDFGLPDNRFSALEIQQSQILHGGVWGDVISAVSSVHSGGHFTITLTFPEASWTVNQWAGYTLSLYYRPGAGLQPFADYLVSSSTATTLTVSALFSAPYVVGDVVVMRALASSITPNTIGDANFVNSYSPAGLTVNAESGNLIQVIRGTGAGSAPKSIASNTATVFTINGTWDVTPDSTSVFLVISQTFTPSYTAPIVCDGTTAPSLWGNFVVASGVVLQLSGGSILIQVATADAYGNSYPMRYQPFREIYVPPSSLPNVSATSYAVPISGGTATPNCSQAVNVLTETADTFVAAPIGLPGIGSVFSWRLVIVLGAAGCSTQFDPSYAFAVTATGPDSPINSTVTLNLSTDSTGATTLISVSATT